MSVAMPERLFRDRRGGAMVELAICTVVVVPLILYSTWFADIAHWKIKLEEASIEPAMDMTAWKVNDFSRTNPNFTSYYNTAISGATADTRAIPSRMQSSFDSVDTGAPTYQASVYVVPRNLQVTCRHFANSTPRNTVNYNSAFDTNQSRNNEGVPEFNLHAWVTCHASARMQTAGMPHNFQELDSLSATNPGRHGWGSFSMCGIGPGVQGCGSGANQGLPIMLDDWGLSSFTNHEDLDLPLALADYNDNLPGPPPAILPASVHWTPKQNADYFKMTKRYWRDPDPRAVQNVMNYVANSEDMGLTDYFHVSYRFGIHHGYGNDGSIPTTQEMDLGQRDAYGGPNYQTTAGPNGPPHTGGPWHEENPTPGNPEVSHESFNRRRSQHYLGVQGWADDGSTSRTSADP